MAGGLIFWPSIKFMNQPKKIRDGSKFIGVLGPGPSTGGRRLFFEKDLGADVLSFFKGGEEMF